jgi:hypothetical protein
MVDLVEIGDRDLTDGLGEPFVKRVFRGAVDELHRLVLGFNLGQLWHHFHRARDDKRVACLSTAAGKVGKGLICGICDSVVGIAQLAKLVQRGDGLNLLSHCKIDPADVFLELRFMSSVHGKLAEVVCWDQPCWEAEHSVLQALANHGHQAGRSKPTFPGDEMVATIDLANDNGMQEANGSNRRGQFA